MQTILNFKDDFSAVDIADGWAIVSMPLTNKKFRELYDNRENKKLAIKELAYVAYIASHKSPGLLKGLSRKELKKDAVSNIGLPITWEEDIFVVNAIEEYKKNYSHGIFGTVIELRKSYEHIRRSSTLLSKALEESLEALEKDRSAGELIGEHLKNRVKSLLDSFSVINDITSKLEINIRDLHNIEKKVGAEEVKQKIGRGDTYIPESARSKN